MKYFKILVLLLFGLNSYMSGQLTEIKEKDTVTEGKIFKDLEGNQYSMLVKFKFKFKLVDMGKGEIVSFQDIKYPSFKIFLKELEEEYCPFSIKKAFPNAVWGDTLRLNKRTKKTVSVIDLSQYYILDFEKPVPTEKILSILEENKNISFAEGPTVARLLSTEPNDPMFHSNSSLGPIRWSFDAIDATLAWDITKGSSSIKVGISDFFYEQIPLHTDIDSKVVWDANADLGRHGSHGTKVAGVVAAETNNNIDIASIGWNTSLMLAYTFNEDIYSLVDHGADIINFSWGVWDGTFLHDVILYAIEQGVILVAAAGNSTATPFVAYPAACNFGTLGQVIAVSGTEINQTDDEEFIEGYNYSPGTDPINDPTNAFIDVAAPGWNFSVLSPTSTSGTVEPKMGTSYASPTVAGTIALMLSVNNNLTVNEVYNILKNSSEKIGQASYNANGWNQYLGYGRINAYQALKYTIENYGATFTQNSTLPVDNWNFKEEIAVSNGGTLTIQEGTNLTFQNGSSLIVDGTLNVAGTSSNKVTLDFIAKNSNGIKVGSGGTATITNAIIENAYSGVQITGSSASATINYCTIEHCTIGVKFMNGATGTVFHTTSKYNSYGVYTSYSNPIIQNCTITNNTYGLKLFNSYSTPTWNTTHISNNNIANNSAYGVYVYNSSPTLSNNTLSNNARGMVLYYSSDPKIETTSFDNSTYYGLACNGSASPNLNYNSTYGFGGYNTITENGNRGIIITGTSFPDLGAFTPGYNSIYNNTGYEVYNSSSHPVHATYNWWGSSSGLGSSTLYGTVYYLPYLNYDPNEQQDQKALSNSNSLQKTVQGNPIELPQDLQLALAEQSTENYKSSANRLKAYFTNSKNTKYIELATAQYIKSLRGYLDNKYVLNEISTEVSKKQSVIAKCELLSGEASLLSLQQQPIEAISKLDRALELKLTKETRNRLLAQKAVILIYDANSKEKGKIILEEIVKNSSKETAWTELALQELMLLDGKIYSQKENVKTISAEMPNEYKLLQNYPNPFNPTTQISYQIPKDGFVNLIVYNTLGQVVKELVNQHQTSGKYSVQFNASSLTSGIYFYKIESGNFVQVNKMLLLR